MPLLMEEVFKVSGVPTHTFVKPVEYERLLIALRTSGRGVVIEGPSAIGKTTAVTSALTELNVTDKVLRLTARKQGDRELIMALPEMADSGVVIIDDFHRLELDIQHAIADHLKTLADEERSGTKLILVGINKAGDTLVRFAPDLNSRIDTIRFEANPEDRVRELVCKGENALNLSLNIKEEIVSAARGSFFLAQMLCFETCVSARVSQAQDVRRSLVVSFPAVVYLVMERLARSFRSDAMTFAAGPRLRREGRAPYLHILKWLAEANDWSISLQHEVARHPDLRASAGQVVDKEFLVDFLQSHPELSSLLHYDPSTTRLSVEDPQFVFYLRNLSWSKFAEQVGFLNIHFEQKYDFALSFAGSERPLARRFFEVLAEHELAVFYDRNEQARMLASNIEEYLGPIYSSEARFVVCLLSPEYPKRIWTVFESEQFKKRFGKDGVIPIWFTTAPPGAFDESSRFGGLTFDPTDDVDRQVRSFVDLLRMKISQVALEMQAKG
jgi:hypothetical protein